MIQTPSDAAKTAAKTVRRGDAIDQWLAMFTRFLRLPREQTGAIRDELDSHMRERVRDLMLEGLSEDEGMRRAIDELGEAAELAAHFRAAHKPARRLAMSIAAIGVAAGAAVISVVALTNSQPPQAKPEMLDGQVVSKVDPASRRLVNMGAPVEKLDPSDFLDDVEVEFATKLDPRSGGKGVPVLRDVPIVGSMFVPAQPARGEQIDLAPVQPRFDIDLTQTTVRDVAEVIASKMGKRVMFHAGDTKSDAKIEKIRLVEADVPTAMREINRALGLAGPDAIDFRVRTDVIEVGPVRDFDRVEQSLVAYDLREVYACDANSEDLVSAVLQFVESDGWRDNGGDTARLKVVGTKMFVEAPPRYHERVAWILSQFSRKPAKASAEPMNLAPLPGMGGGRADAAVDAAPAAAGIGATNAGGGVPGGGRPGGMSATGVGTASAAPRATNAAAAAAGGAPFGSGAPGGAPVTNDPTMSTPASR